MLANSIETDSVPDARLTALSIGANVEYGEKKSRNMLKNLNYVIKFNEIMISSRFAFSNTTGSTVKNEGRKASWQRRVSRGTP